MSISHPHSRLSLFAICSTALSLPAAVSAASQCSNCTPVSITSPNVSVPVLTKGTDDTAQSALSSGLGKFTAILFHQGAVTLPSALAPGRYAAWCATQVGDQA